MPAGASTVQRRLTGGERADRSTPSPLTGRALELFLTRLVQAADALAKQRGDKTLTAGHL